MATTAPAILPTSADYTDRDLASLRSRLKTLIRSVNPSWSDFQAANFGTILTDLFAFSADIMGFAQDAQAAEAFIATATQRASLLKMAKLMGYQVAGATAATTLETFSGVGLTADVDISAGTIVKTLSTNPIEFQTLSPITLTVAVPTASVFVENSTNASDTFAAPGTADFAFPLSQTPYLAGSLTLTSSVQGAFTEQEGNSFIVAGPSDQVFVVKVDDNDVATIVFGDGVAGAIPTGGTLTASYRVGGGAIGNAASNSIRQIDTPLTDVHSNPVVVTCNNANAATGGADREAVESIRENIPASLKARAVSVSRSDFENHAKEIASVDRALALTSNEDVSVPVNTIYMFLVTSGPGGPDTADAIVQDAVRRQFQSDETPPWPMMATQALRVFPPGFVDFDVTAKVYLKRNTVPAAVRTAIAANLSALFATTASDGSENELIDFAYNLRDQSLSATPIGVVAASDVENAIRDTPGVREVDPSPAGLTLAATHKVYDPTSGVYQSYVINPSTMASVATWTIAAARQDIQIDRPDPAGGPPPASNFPRLSSISLVDADTGLAL